MAKMVPAGALNVQHGGELDGVTDSPVVSMLLACQTGTISKDYRTILGTV